MFTVYRVEHQDTGVGPYNHWRDIIRPSNLTEDALVKSCQAAKDFIALADLLNEYHRPGYEHDNVMRLGVGSTVGLAKSEFRAAYEEEISSDDIVCACPTIHDLLQWFEGFWELLYELGFRAVEYTVSHVYEDVEYIGSNQVLIWKGEKLS